MKRTFLAFVFAIVASLFSCAMNPAFAQSDGGKVVIVKTGQTGVNGGYTYVDTGALGTTLTANGGNTAPTWQPVSETFPLAADSATSSATLINLPLKVAIAANETRDIRAVLFVNTDSATGMKVAVTVPSGATITAAADGNTTAVTAWKTDRITASATATVAFSTAVAGVGRIIISGTVKNGSTAGFIQIQFETVTNGKVTVKALSSLVSTKFF